MKPLFIFSLPRSGSTLLQRILSSRDEIDTVSEPWLLLPLLQGMKPSSIVAEYSQDKAGIGIEDFIKQLDGGEAGYKSELGQFVIRLYERVSRKKYAKYFLDKTPRYHVVVDEIMEIFPEGKFIFLWRNPLSIAASMSSTWDAGNWNLYYFEMDLYDGISNLLVAYRKNQQRSISVRYEDLLTGESAVWKKIFDYLDLPCDDWKVFLNNANVTGRLGDKMGVEAYAQLSKEPELKWKEWVCNPIRKVWCRHYLNWLGSERISAMGYSIDDLLCELDTIPFGIKYVALDIVRIAKGRLRNLAFKKMFDYLNRKF